MTPEEDALLPCPFCGRAPRLTERGASPADRSPTKKLFFLACHGGGFSAHAHQGGYSFAEVAGKWNTRWTP